MSLRFPVQKFRVLPGNDLAEKHFAEFPVWSEHYDYDDGSSQDVQAGSLSSK